MPTPKTTINIHPKVFTSMLVGLGVAIVAAIAGALSPDLFSALGVWQGPAFALATTGLAVLGGWLKGVQSDEQRAAVQAAKAAVKIAAAPAVPAPVAEPAPLPEPAHLAEAPAGTQSSVIRA